MEVDGIDQLEHSTSSSVDQFDGLESLENVSSADQLERLENVSSAIQLERLENVSSVIQPERTENISSAMQLESLENISSADQLERLENISSADQLESLVNEESKGDHKQHEALENYHTEAWMDVSKNPILVYDNLDKHEVIGNDETNHVEDLNDEDQLLETLEKTYGDEGNSLNCPFESLESDMDLSDNLESDGNQMNNFDFENEAMTLDNTEQLKLDAPEDVFVINSKKQRRQPVRNFRRGCNVNEIKSEECNVNERSTKMAQNRCKTAYAQIDEPEIELERIINEEQSHHSDINVEDLILEIDNKLVTKEIKQKLKLSIEGDMKNQKNAEIFHSNKDNIVNAFLESTYGSKLCSVCQEPSTVYCSVCSNLCLEHDISHHMENAFHQRYKNLTKLPPGLAKTDQGFVSYPVLVPRSTPIKCQCGSEAFSSEVLGEKVTVVDLISGCFLASRKGFRCHNCQSLYPLQLKELFGEKLYPLNGSVASLTLVTFRTLDYYKLVKNENPGIGEANFLRVISKHSEMNITQQSFSEAYQEYNCIITHIDENIKKEQNNDCPAKLSHYTRVHSDGISKLRRFNPSFQLKEKNERSFYETDANEGKGGPFIINDKFLNDEITVYKKYKMVSKNSLYFCGTSKYAAGNNSEANQNKYDEKGLQVCSCSHYFYLSAANQLKGEIFCLNNVLLTDLKLRGYNVCECNLDIACKYKKWNRDLHKNNELMAELQLNPNVKPDPKFCVGDFHSKSHVFQCLVKDGHLYNGIGRAAAGEQQEVLNFKLAKLSLTTRFMRPQKRNDTIKEFMLYENKKRNSNIVAEMIKKEKSFRKDIRENNIQLTKLEFKLNMVFTDESIDQLRDAATKSDMEVLTRMEREVELCVLAVNTKKVQMKSNFDPTIKKKIRDNLNSAVRDLHRAVNDYNRNHDNTITAESVLDGLFPWTLRHLPEQCTTDTANFVKGCELYLKIKRTNEELEIIGHDLYSVLFKRFIDLEGIEIELNSLNTFSDCVIAVKKERREELLRQVEYEVLQVQSSTYSDIVKTLPEKYLQKLSLSNSSFKTKDNEEYSEICIDVFNTVEDL